MRNRARLAGVLALSSALLGLLALGCQAPAPGAPASRGEALEASALVPGALQVDSLRGASQPALELLEAGPDGLRLELVAGRLSVGAEPRDGRLWSTLDCQGCGVTAELGKPRLPVIRRLVEVPAGATVSVELKGAARRALPLSALGAQHPLMPVQRPVEKLPGALERAPFDRDEATYLEDALYPAEPIQISEPMFVRGHQLVLVEVRPVRYNPTREALEVLERAELELSFSGPADPRAALASPPRPSPALDALLAGEVINYQATAPKGVSTDKFAEGFLFIVGNSYTANAQLTSYVEDRRAEGHRVEVTPMSAIGTTAAQVRAHVRAQYLAWQNPALSHVVLVGDTADVPVYNGTAGSGGGQVTDLYYASIDPDNYTSDMLAPDLIVSRISVNNATELNTYLTRARKYLWADWPSSTAWLRKYSWIASCDRSNVTEGTHNYVITTHTTPAGYTGTYPANPQAGGDRLYCAQGGASQSNIQTHLGNGRVVINMSGHGGETEWADPSFTLSYLTGVTPPDAAPFVVSNACVTGTFGRSGGDCWGELWLAHSHGAILFWGASNNSYWDEDDILEKRHWDGVFQNGLTRLGLGIRNAKLRLLAHYGDTSSIRYYFEMYNALGDATLDLYTDVPFDPGVSHATEIPVGVDSLDFVVTRAGTAFPGALVCVRGGGVQQVGVTDAAGHVQLVMNPPPADVGALTVTVTGHNVRRTVSSVQVVPADGPYLVHAAHQVTSDGSTPVAPNPGRRVVLPVQLRNIGNQTANDIQAVLSSQSPLVAFVQAQPAFPAIGSNDLGWSTGHAVFDIAGDAPDGALLDFKLDWTTQGGYAGSTRFALSVQRPILAYTGHAVDDAQASCDLDGIADVHENAVFQVTVQNQGSGAASQVTLALSAPDCGVSGPVSLGALPAGQSAVASFTVTPQVSMACPALAVPFSLLAEAAELPAPDVSGFQEVMNADLTTFTYQDDMEGTPPNGWTTHGVTGTNDWAYVTTSYHSPTHAWWCSDPNSSSEKILRTPSITIGDVAELRFWHRVDTEARYDGGILEISVDGGAFTDLGQYITQGGYNETISDWASTPFSGRQAWSGSLSWREVRADLSSHGPASVRLQFRFASDGSVGGNGWWIDDLQLEAETLVCQQQSCQPQNRPPEAHAGPDQDVQPGDAVQLDGSASQDPDGDPIDLTWAQLSGPTVSLSDLHAAQPTFTAPAVAGSAELVFQLTVSDGQASAADQVTIRVWNCDDGEACTQDAFTGTGCSHDPLDDCSPCGQAGVCLAGLCQTPPAGQPVACDDGDLCTTGDICQAGACQGSPLSCQALDACHLVGVCDPATGLCSDPTAADGTGCDDGDLCTQSDACQAGACVGADPVVCAAPGACQQPGACEPATGACAYQAQPDGTACDDGSLCTTADTCQAGACQGSPIECQAPDACHTAACDPADGQCDIQPIPDGGACEDGDLCTTGDTCQAGACQGSPVQCQALDACHLAGVCDPGTGLCSDPTAPDGTACDDGDACTRTDACQAGVCQGQDPIDCGAPPACNSVACDPQSGQCELSPVEDGTACDDGSLCTTADACQAGACQGSPVECQAPDACHTAACDPEDGQCDVQPIPDGGACDDQNPCTLSDTCQAGECIGSPVECQALDACHLPGVCNRATGLCSDPTAANGTPCAEGVCWEGVCGPAPWDTDESGCGCAASGARLPAGSALPGLLLLAALGFLRRRTSAR